MDKNLSKLSWHILIQTGLRTLFEKVKKVL